MIIIREQCRGHDSIPTVRNDVKMLDNGQILLIDVGHPQLAGLVCPILERKGDILALGAWSSENLEGLEGS